MPRLWSPWRSEYIQSLNKPPRTKTKGLSIFSQALAEGDDDKNLIVWRGTFCFVIMNLYPYNSGHLLIVPNRQTADVQSLRPDELLDIMQTIQHSMRALDAAMKPAGYNFGANFGRVSGAGVDEHIHFHVVPRWEGDTNFMPVLADTKVISEEMKKTLKNLRKHF